MAAAQFYASCAMHGEDWSSCEATGQGWTEREQAVCKREWDAAVSAQQSGRPVDAAVHILAVLPVVKRGLAARPDAWQRSWLTAATAEAAYMLVSSGCQVLYMCTGMFGAGTRTNRSSGSRADDGTNPACW